MNRKSFGILIATAVVFVVLAFIGQSRNSGGSIAGSSAGRLLLEGLDIEAVEQITIDGAGASRLVTLDRSGDSWVVAELGGYGAERSQVNALLIDLAEARVVEEKTADPAFHSRLGVEDVSAAEAAGLELTLVAAGGENHALVLGDTYDSNQRYARLAEDSLSVQIDRNPEIARDPAEWVVSDIIDIDVARVQRVEITHADGETLVLTKAARDDTDFAVEAIPEGRELQYAGIGNVTGGLLQALRLEQVRPREDVSTAGSSAITRFFLFDGLVIEIAATAETGSDPWLSFSADFDAGQALAFADEVVDSDIANGDGQNQSAEADEDSEASAADPTAEATAINARLGDWQYRIPSFQYSQLTRRMEDLLRAETGE